MLKGCESSLHQQATSRRSRSKESRCRIPGRVSARRGSRSRIRRRLGRRTQSVSARRRRKAGGAEASMVRLRFSVDTRSQGETSFRSMVATQTSEASAQDLSLPRDDIGEFLTLVRIVGVVAVDALHFRSRPWATRSRGPLSRLATNREGFRGSTRRITTRRRGTPASIRFPPTVVARGRTRLLKLCSPCARKGLHCTGAFMRIKIQANSLAESCQCPVRVNLSQFQLKEDLR